LLVSSFRNSLYIAASPRSEFLNEKRHQNHIFTSVLFEFEVRSEGAAKRCELRIRDTGLIPALAALNYHLRGAQTSAPFWSVAMTANVTITERAARRIGQILKSEGDGAMLRVSVEGGGCSGFQYRFGVERVRADDDMVITRDGVVVVVDPASVPFLAGSELDFVDDLIGASFRVANPNATANCGCGTSFSI